LLPFVQIDGEESVQRLSEDPPSTVADRIRQLAAGVTDPADVAAIESYARRVEIEARDAELANAQRQG
jgi:hypothetical protein